MKTLFLDRDGVINCRILGSYIVHYDDFHFEEGALEALQILTSHFDRLVVVTNQQCIAKEIATKSQIEAIHRKMQKAVYLAGGRIDACFFAPDFAKENHGTRKPSIGMALQAKLLFPAIDFEQSTMVGDSPSDMLFGKKCGMHTCFIQTPHETAAYADEVHDSLLDFARSLK